jgi:hypothetical protein
MTRRELVAAWVLTAITLPPLCVFGSLYYLSEAERFAMGRPLAPPADPDIGLSALYFFAVINIPTAVVWLAVLARYVLRKTPNQSLDQTADRIQRSGEPIVRR